MAGELILRAGSLGDTPRGVLDVRGSTAGKIQTVTGDVTLDEGYSTVLVEASGSVEITVTLPAASGCEGRIYNLKLVDATNEMVIQGDGSDTVEGDAELRVVSVNDCVTLQSDGVSDWWII